MKIIPRYYQQDCIEAFFEYTLNNWGKHPLMVLPTASGKSIVIAKIIEKMLEYPDTRILCLTHQKELIKQNYLEFMGIMGDQLVDAGIYSAGLKSRDTRNRVIFAGIQSVHKKAYELGWFDVVLIDEVHRVPKKSIGTFRYFLKEIETINKNVVIAGLSATIFRLKSGILCEGKDKLFDEICYNVDIAELINANHPRNRDKKQYLSDLISKNAANRVDLSDVHLQSGEFKKNELETAFKKDNLVEKAVTEIKELTSDRKKTLVFTSGIDHCIKVSESLNSHGLSARFIHSNQDNKINDQNILDFKAGKFKYLVNIDILTTGFNEKAIDCICILRSTMSPGLYIQIVGRGSRLHPSKKDCLVLDFGKNIIRHGPIDKIIIRKRADGTSEVQAAPMKECGRQSCDTVMHISVMVCPDCGWEFPAKPKHDELASSEDILSKWKKPEAVDISHTLYRKHTKIGGTDSMRVEYYYDMYNCHSEWICIEHRDFAHKKAMAWLEKRTTKSIKTVDEALAESKNFPSPSQIIVDFNERFPRITGYVFGEKKKTNEMEGKELDFKELAL